MTRRPTIDWEQAFGFFAGLGPIRSYVKVADKYGVSEGAVRKQARLQDWERRSAELDAKTRKAVEAKVVRERTVRLAETVEVVELARNELLVQLRGGRADVKLADLPALVKLELLIEGDPTDRIQHTEATAMLRAWLSIAGRYIPEKNRAAFVEEIRALSGESAEEQRALPGGPS